MYALWQQRPRLRDDPPGPGRQGQPL
jgi:hypothetical protein